MYTELLIGGETYKLRLTTKASISLEKALGYNPITMLMKVEENEMPKLGDILIILQACLQAYHHGFNMDKTYDLFDQYVADGHNMFDLIPVFVEVFQQSGYLATATKSEETDEKN